MCVLQSLVSSPTPTQIKPHTHTQSIPLRSPKTSQTQQMFINLNGRIEYTLDGTNTYPTGVRAAKILSLAVSSLETDGVACTNGQ